MNGSHAQAVESGEATMSLRVIRNNGEVEQHQGDPVEIEIPAALVAEYRQAIKTLRDVESRIMQHMTGA
jgi:hypothetical protein